MAITLPDKNIRKIKRDFYLQRIKHGQVEPRLMGLILNEKPPLGKPSLALSQFLRQKNDEQYQIFSKLNKQGEWVRNATQALPLDQRISPDSPIIEANNALLRCLSRLRSIDYAIGKKHGDVGDSMRETIRKEWAAVALDILMTTEGATTVNLNERNHQLKEIKTIEKEFNTLLIEQLYGKFCPS